MAFEFGSYQAHEWAAAVERESMEFDVVIVGAGPCRLSAAIRLKQLAEKAGTEVSVCVLEKGSEVGAHILSGAVIDPVALNELIPDWKEKGAPLKTEVKEDRFYMLGHSGALRLPNFMMPPLMNNHGNYAVSLGNVCRWLAEQAEGLGVEIYPGFACSDLVYRDDGSSRVSLPVSSASARTASPARTTNPAWNCMANMS